MNTEILVPAAVLVNLEAYSPYIPNVCIVPTSVEPIPPEPENAIFTPVPPGITYESLPAIDIESQVIDTSPDQIIGCVNELPTSEQLILNSFFPSAVNKDGVIDRATNNIWVYDGTTWSNVGPNPGRIISVPAVIPPWNEVLIAIARTRTKLSVNALAYPLELLTEPDPIATLFKLRVDRSLPAAGFTTTAPLPVYIGTQATVVQVNATEILSSAVAPSIQIFEGDTFVLFSMDGLDGATSISSIDNNSIAATFFGGSQLDTSIKKWGDSSLQFPSSGDFVEFTAPDSIGTSDFTVEFWVYIPATSADFGTLAMISDLFSIDYDSSSGELYYYVAEGAGDGITHQNTITKEVWHHIALYRNNGTVYLALDGVVSTTSAPEPHDFTGTLHRLNDWEGNGSFSTQSYIDDYRLTLLVAVYGTSDFAVPSGPFIAEPQNIEFQVPLSTFNVTVNDVIYIGTFATVLQSPSVNNNLLAPAPLVLTSVVLEVPLTTVSLAPQAPSVFTSPPPELITSSSVYASTSALTIDISGIYDTDDILLLVAETSGDASAATPDSGLFPDWNVMPNTPVTDVSSSSGSKLQAWWYRATSPTAYSSIDFPDTGDHQIARVFVIRGCTTTGNPWDATSSFFNANASTIAAGGGVTTTVAQTFVFSIVSHPIDTTSTTQFGTPSNSVLQNLTDVGEISTDQGNGGGFAVATGVMKFPGEAGFILYLTAPNATYASFSAAFKP